MFRNKLVHNPGFYLGLLGLLFCLIELIIHPVGNFPLNDEWLYTHMVLDFRENHVVDTSHWGYTSMLAHILYGNLVVSIFGFSYTILHYSTLIWSLLGVIFFYRLLNDFILKHPFHSFLLSLVVLANPLYVSLSNSFMTDVPFITSVIIGLYFYLKYRLSKNVLLLLVSSAFLVWAILIRQLGVSFVIGIFISEVLVNRKNLFPGLFILLSALGGLFAFECWLHVNSPLNGYSYLFFKNATFFEPHALLDNAVNFAKRWIHYISFTGFVLFPILIPKLSTFIKNKEFSKNPKVVLFSVLLYVPVVWSMQKFPIGNYLYNTGVGPETLLDTYILGLNQEHSFSFIFFIIKMISYLGSFSLLVILVEYALLLKQREYLRLANFLITVILISLFFYYSFLALASPIFDRYIMVFSILIVPVIASVYKSLFNHTKLLLLFTVILCSFSVFSAKDYFLGHATRWVAIDFLKNEYKVPDEQINGGLEHESKVFFDKTNWFDKWNNAPKNAYVISYGPINGYRKFTWFTYQRVIPCKTDTLFILKADDIH